MRSRAEENEAPAPGSKLKRQRLATYGGRPAGFQPPPPLLWFSYQGPATNQRGRPAGFLPSDRGLLCMAPAPLHGASICMAPSSLQGALITGACTLQSAFASGACSLQGALTSPCARGHFIRHTGLRVPSQPKANFLMSVAFPKKRCFLPHLAHVSHLSQPQARCVWVRLSKPRYGNRLKLSG